MGSIIYRGLEGKLAPMPAAGAWECNLRTEELTWTGGVYDVFGLPRGVRVSRPATVQMYFDDCRQQMERLRAEAIRTGNGFTLDARIQTERGATKWMRLTAGVEMAQGQAVRIFGSKQDITQEREGWERLRQRADCDALTGLANRAVFDALCHELARGRRDDVAAMLVIDLDRFKQINDLMGHAAGDECLRQLAERLRWAFGQPTLVARIGGDEFVVLLRTDFSRARMQVVLAEALTLLCQPVIYGKAVIDITVSIGAAMRRRGDMEPSRLFAEADAALYRAKSAGGNRSCVQGGAVEGRRALGGRMPLRLG